MRDALGNWLGLGLGDSSEEIRSIRAYMRRKFSYAALLDDTTLYDEAMTTVVSDMQRRYVANARLRFDAFVAGVINLETKYVMGYLARPVRSLPVIFTVQGHMGGMFDGPAYFTARWLEENSLARVQPVWYDNVSLPFKNATGTRELHRLVNDPATLPPGTPWVLLSHSQGGIIASSYYLNSIRPNLNVWPYNAFRCGIAFGNPYRERDTIAEWVPDPPKPGTQGISNRRMVQTPPNWKEVSRTGDLYAENTTDNTGEYKTAVYRAVQGELFGADSLSEQMWELTTRFGPELWSVFKAIVSGVRFVGNTGPHDVYDLRPCVDFLRASLH